MRYSVLVAGLQKLSKVVYTMMSISNVTVVMSKPVSNYAMGQ